MTRLAALILLALVASMAAGSDDPEPPGGGKGMRMLRGTWKVTGRLLDGVESKAPPSLIYTFDGTKLTIVGGKSKTSTFALELDTKKQPPTLLLKPENGSSTRRMAFRMKGKDLHLAISPLKGNLDAPLTFDGKSASVLILERVKK